MARAPSSGPAGAILKLPAPLLKTVLVFGVVGSTLGATLLVASVTGVTVASAPQSGRKKGTITYTITVTNTGSASASDVVIESHVPDGATLSNWVCAGQTVQAKGASSFTCGNVGPAPAPNHPLVFAV